MHQGLKGIPTNAIIRALHGEEMGAAPEIVTTEVGYVVTKEAMCTLQKTECKQDQAWLKHICYLTDISYY